MKTRVQNSEGKSHESALIISHSSAKPGTALTLQAERLETSGIRTRCLSNGLGADIRDALKELTAEDVDGITIMPLTFVTGFRPLKPIPEEKMKEILKNTGLPENVKILEQKPLVIPESVKVKTETCW